MTEVKEARPRDSRVVVCPVEELPVGAVKHLDAGKFGVGVYNVGGTLHALTNYCPHRGAPVCLGPVTGLTQPGEDPYAVRVEKAGEILRCPWHGMEFDIATGVAIVDSRYSIKKLPVAVEDGMIVVDEAGDA
jgi:nitrite reductase/ring-hydroxylating ferredoxin subunit